MGIKLNHGARKAIVKVCRPRKRFIAECVRVEGFYLNVPVRVQSCQHTRSYQTWMSTSEITNVILTLCFCKLSDDLASNIKSE